MQNIGFNSYYLNFLSLNICLIPFFLVTGPFLSDLSLTICSLSYLFYLFINKQLNTFKNFFFIFFLIFYLILVISSLLSDNILFSLKSSLPYIRFGLFFMCFIYTANKDKNLFNKIFLILTIIFLVLIFDGYLQFFTGHNIFQFDKTGVRISSFFNDEHILGSYVARFFPIYLGLFFLWKNKKIILFYEKIFFVIFFLLISLLVVISGERTSFGLLVITILIMFFFLHGIQKIKIIALIGFILVNLSFIKIYPSNFDRLVNETRDQIIDGEKLFFFGERRHEYAVVSINIFKDHIFLGSGPKTYRKKSNDEKYMVSRLSWNTHPHNLYFQLLAETGIIGTFLIFIVFSYFVKTLFKEKIFEIKNIDFSYFESNAKICFIIAIMINIFPLVPSGNFFNNWMSIVFYYPIAIFFGYSHSLKD